MTLSIPPTPERAAATRQVLTKRQSATVDALLEAGLASLRETGFAGLSLREVATRAGVTHTTAYNYFTSKEHLVAELNWRLLRSLPTPEPDPAAPIATRLVEALREASRLYSGDAAFAEALLAAMVATDPEIQRIRTEIGLEMVRRIEVALGPDVERRLVEGALLLYSGAMLQAGLGYFTFDEVVDRVGEAAALWQRPE